MTGTILGDIKRLLGVHETDNAFDVDITIHINTFLMTLSQLGMKKFKLVTGNETWEQYLEGEDDYTSVSTYLYLKVKLVFDPPATSFAMDAYAKAAKELEWRILVEKTKGA